MIRAGDTITPLERFALLVHRRGPRYLAPDVLARVLSEQLARSLVHSTGRPIFIFICLLFFFRSHTLCRRVTARAGKLRSMEVDTEKLKELRMEMLGHSNIAITLDTYSHVLPNMQDSAARALEEALR